MCGNEDALFAQCPGRVAVLAARVVRPFVELQLHLSTTSWMLASCRCIDYPIFLVELTNAATSILLKYSTAPHRGYSPNLTYPCLARSQLCSRTPLSAPEPAEREQALQVGIVVLARGGA